MPIPAAIKQLGNRSEIKAPPQPAFELSPLPPEIVRAFPKMEDWRKQQNQRLAEHAKKINSAQTY